MNFICNVILYLLAAKQLKIGRGYKTHPKNLLKSYISKEKLIETTIIQIKTYTSHIHKSSNEFVIYEGDWGKPYIARFEVWYKDEKSNNDSMIMCKNYIIEGWQR